VFVEPASSKASAGHSVGHRPGFPRAGADPRKWPKAFAEPSGVNHDEFLAIDELMMFCLYSIPNTFSSGNTFWRAPTPEGVTLGKP
jgi:hypothetical protein